jgi:nucleoside-diphosphate-sugar epimerase
MAPPPVRAIARSVAHGALGDSDRVLVTGAGGWFGTTVAALLHGSGVATHFVTQRPREVTAGDSTFTAHAWDDAEIARFAPTVVIDCAFVLREYAREVGIEHYVYENTRLTQRLLGLTRLPGVERIISVSSGAAVHPRDGVLADVEEQPYEYLKRQAEFAVAAAADAARTTVVIARPWSLSGSLIQRPHRYAFADLILQARAGDVDVRADHEVWRRYVGVDDFFAVCLAASATGPATIDSGGELLELGGLAHRIADVLGIRPSVRRAPTSGAADAYYSDESTWLAACAAVGFTPASLDEQIATVDAYLSAAGVR